MDSEVRMQPVQPMTNDAPILHLSWKERVESLKAGAIAAMAVCISMAIILSGVAAVSAMLPTLHYPSFFPPVSLPQVILSGAIAILSGGLFGITYRYAVRGDRNPHLKSGVVGAFGLTRGLAQLETGLVFDGWWLSLLLIATSLIEFAIAQRLLDWAIHQGWVQPFVNSHDGQSHPSSRLAE
jgi:hypothetical protein